MELTDFHLTDNRLDPVWIETNRRTNVERCGERIPGRYADATPDHQDVANWVREITAGAVGAARAMNPVIRSGPSLLILGPVGTGKTYQAHGAIRALAHSGCAFSWLITTAADVYAQLRPRPRVDSEKEFERISGTTVLVLDDLGAAKATEWTEEVNYRLINHRYELELPTIITSNLQGRELVAQLGERVASRLVEMCRRTTLLGKDRRYGTS
ncbi:hypothetical protein SUDANB95_05481 [Actinosynnema sp. ALI-1.44]